jgi:glyoxylase-like metal-dependent hydrolase (beta-lactamase superfamily II)
MVTAVAGKYRAATVRVALAGAMGFALWSSGSGNDVLALQTAQSGNEIRVIPVRGNVYVLAGAGANIVASVGKDGVLLVDTGTAAMSGTIIATLQELSRHVTASPQPQKSCVGVVRGCAWWNSSLFLSTTVAPPAPKPIVGIINTSFDPDHMGGNAAVAAAGKSHINIAPQPAWILAHGNAPPRQGVLADALPTETYDEQYKKLNFFNGEGVVVWHLPAAHTSGDSIVQFRESEVLAAGDVFNMAGYPVIDMERGGTIQGLIDALNWILDMAVVEHMMEGGTIIVPGHGRMADSADVAYYRDMVTIMRDRVQAMVKRGMSLQQIKAAKLTRDYDPRCNRNPNWTADMFIEAIYRTLNSKEQTR